MLAGSLNVDHLVDRLLGFLVPELAAYAQVTLVDRTDSHSAAYRCVDDDVPVGGPVRTRWRLRSRGPRSVYSVVVTGRRAYDPALAAEEIDAVVAPEGREQARTLLPCPAVVLPLAAGGSVFGTLTMLAPTGRPFDGGQVAFWEELAERAALALHSARLYEDRRHALTVLQRDLHPPTLPKIDGLEIGAFFRPADAVGGLGGDFYDVVGEPGDWTVLLGDVSGKGVEAAVLAGRVRQIVRTAAFVDRSPGAVLGLLNKVLLSSAGDYDERFVTIVSARLRPAEGGWTADVASAGHPLPIVLRMDGHVEPVASAGALVGQLPDVTYAEERVTLAPGEVLLMFTDGVTESRDVTGELFGPERVAALMSEATDAEPQAVVAHVARTAMEWRGTSRQDDIALLAMRPDPRPYGEPPG